MTTTGIEDDIAAGIRHDLFKAIEFKSRSGNSGTTTGLQLGAHFVFKWMFQVTWNHFRVTIPAAKTAKWYSCEMLFNDQAKWNSYETGTHLAMGRCLMFYCERKMLPIECANPFASGIKFYWVHSKQS